MTYRLHVVVLLLVSLATGASHADTPPNVFVSIKPVHSLVSALMQGVAEPALLVGGSAPPQTHTLTPAQQTQLKQADLIIWTGAELEPFLAAPLADKGLASKTLELLASDALKVLPARTGDGRDAFFWLDSRNMLILLDELADLLTEIDPSRAHRYDANHRRIQKPLSRLDRELEYAFKEVSAKPVFFYHDTQQYFEQAYAMKSAGSLSTPPGGKGDTAELLAMRPRLKEADSACFFTEAGLPTDLVPILVEGSDIKVVKLDSLGADIAPGPDLYFKLMESNFRKIRECISPNTARGHADMDDDILSHRIDVTYLLRDHNGRTITNMDFANQYQLVYFGYTFCPDICPTALSIMASAFELLGDKSDRIQPIFISVDPQRDTPEKLAQYAAYFHPRLLGLTGPENMIKRIADGYRVKYRKVPHPDGDPNLYAIDHSAGMYIIGPNSEFLAKLAHGLPPEETAKRISELMDQTEK